MNWLAADLPTEFRSFKQYCELIFSGPFRDKEQAERVTYILLWVGQEGLRMYNTWDLTDVERQNVNIIWTRFTATIEPKSNFRLNRFHLQKFKQSTTETADEFMIRCKTHARKCQFRDAVETEERLIEQLILGVRHAKIQEKLLGRDDTLTLDAAMDVVKTHEATVSNMHQFTGESNVSHVSRTGKKWQPRDASKHRDGQQNCRNCGRRHNMNDLCPAKGSKCRLCNKYNHWQSVCRQEKVSGTEDKRHQSSDRRRRKSRDRTPYRTHDDKGRDVNSISQATGQLTENFETMTFDSVKVGADNRDELYTTLNIELKNRPDIPATLKANVDTGAQGNVLPLRTYKRMYPSDIAADGLPKRGTLENNDTVLTAYNGQTIPQYGTLRLRCSHAANNCEAMFFVADTPGPAIIGLPSCRELSLVVLNCEITQTAQINTKDDLQRQYPDRFEGIGKFRGDFHITLDPTVTPVIHAVRRCSIHLKDEVKTELDNMEELGVI